LKNWKSSAIIASIALVAVCAVWGSTFLIVQNAVSRMPVMDFLAVRFTVATLVMFALRPTCLRGMTAQGLRRGAGLGVMLGLGYITQTYGLRYASATVSGFITGMFVVFTPVMSWLILGKKVNRNTILAVVLATVGLALLSLHGWSVGTGELLTLACAVIALAVALPGGIKLPPDASTWETVGITAVFATAAAFLVQTWTQSLVPAVTAAIIMTMEPVFAGIFGVLFGKNQLTVQIIFGAVCVLTAMLMVAIKSSAKTTKLEN
jgi:drug/metabolite transporter (DMT)-like permease